MSAKQTLMPSMNCPTSDFLETALAVYQVRGFLSRNQARAIIAACVHYLPAHVSLVQRTPKGLVYVNLNDKPHCEVTTRAHTYDVFNLSEPKGKFLYT